MFYAEPADPKKLLFNASSPIFAVLLHNFLWGNHDLTTFYACLIAMGYSIPSPIFRIRRGDEEKSWGVGISLGFDMLKLCATLCSSDAHPSTWILILARRCERAVVIGSP